MALADGVKFQTHACSDVSRSPFSFDPELSGRVSVEAYSPIKRIPTTHISPNRSTSFLVYHSFYKIFFLG